MANGIGRKRTLGIGSEATYGTVVSPSYVLPINDTPRINITVNKEEDTASLGSIYEIDEVTNTTRMASVSMEVKVDEDTLPIFLKQFCTITSVTASGETAVYEHTCVVNNNSRNTSYSLFLDDTDRTSLYVTGFMFSQLNLTVDQGYFRVNLEGTGRFTETWTGSNSVSAINTFVGRNANVYLANFGGTTASFETLSAEFNHSLNLSADDSNFVLGNEDMNSIYQTSLSFQNKITALFEDFTQRDRYTANTAVVHKVQYIDTGRNVSGSVASTKPSVTAEYPIGYVKEWTDEGGQNELLKQSITITPTDRPGVTNAPAFFKVVNAVASY